MTDWIEHNGGPQPVADDVWVEIDEGHIDHDCGAAREFDWNREEWFRWNIINQHLIDAALKRGIRLGLNAAMASLLKRPNGYKEAGALLVLTPETIAKETQHD